MARDKQRFRKVYPFIRKKPVLERIGDTATIDSESNDGANVNVFITSVSTTQVVVETSQTFTGTVHYHAIQGN